MAEIVRRLDTMGIPFETCIWGQPLPSCDIISIVELEKPLLHELSEDTFDTAISYMQKHKARMVWATKACQIDCQAPESALTLGLARTVRNEYSLELYTVELDQSTTVTRATEALIDIFCRASTSNLDLESMDHDYEYALVDGNVLIPRFHWQTMSSALSEVVQQETTDSTLKHINMSTPGLLHTMKWVDGVSKAPAKDEVLVEVKAVGLNFRVRIHPFPQASDPH